MYVQTARRFVRQVQGPEGDLQDLEIELSTDDLVIREDLDTESAGVAALMGLVGDLIGEWSAAAEMADARYRRWRAQISESAYAQEGKSPTEAKLKAAIEADPIFEQHKAGIAQLTGELEFMRAFFAALQVKSTQLRGLMDRDQSAARQAGRSGVPSQARR